VPREAKDNFAVRLGNLNKLKKGLEKYYTEVLMISHTNIVEHIEISAVARSADKPNLIFLLELVMGAVVNCPAKQAYISRILSLDERFQTELMVFIQKILKKTEKNSSLEDESAETRADVQQLRKENRSLSLQVEELHNSLEEIAQTQSEILLERDSLRKQLKDFEAEIEKKNTKKFPSDVNLNQLEAQMSQKEGIIQDLRGQIIEIKKQHSNEISTLKDELDVLNEKNLHLLKVESTLEVYKKRLEDSNVLKKRIQELEKDLKNSKDQLKQYEEDVAEVEKFKQTIDYFTEQHANDKERVADLAYRLEEKDKELKETLKSKDELNQKKVFLDNKVKELMRENENIKYRQDSGRTDEESSLQRGMITEYEKQIEKLEQENRRLRTQNGGEGIIKEINAQLDRVLIEKKNAEEKFNNERREAVDLKRDLEALKREYSQLKEESNSKITELANDLNSSSSDKQTLQNKIMELEKDKIQLEHVSSENERIKKERENYLQEMKNFFKEKDEVQQKLLETKEEVHKLQSHVALKESLYKASEIEKEKIENKLKEAVESERIATSELKILKNKSEMTDSNVDKIKFLELERDIMKLNSEISNLKLNLREKDDQLNHITQEKSKQEQELHQLLKKREEELSINFSQELEKVKTDANQKSLEIAFLQKSREEITSSWNKEMKLMSIIVHEVGMEIMRANRTLKDDKSWLNIKRINKN
jgi:chromosome segregation ATPase